jgi:hypothetical protein
VGLSIAPNGPQDQSTIDASDNAALLELFANSFVKGESRDESAEEKVQCSDKYENLQRRMLMRERPLATTVRTRTCRLPRPCLEDFPRICKPNGILVGGAPAA